MIQQNTLIMKNQNDLGGHDQQQQQQDEEEEEQPLNSLYLNRPTRGAGYYYNPNQKTISTQSIISNFNSDNIDLKKKETAVAALSATLAFQRFDNGLFPSNNNNLDDSIKSRESVNDTIKKIQDGTNITSNISDMNKRISPMKGATDMNTIFMNMNKRRISSNNSKRADNNALRRSLQGTLGLSPGASSSSINAGYISSFRRSLQETQSGSQLTLDISDDDDKDDDSIDSKKRINGIDIKSESEKEGKEINNTTDLEEEDKESSMTMNVLESKQLSLKYSQDGTTASGDGSENNNDIINGEDDNMEASSKSLDLEASDELHQIEKDAMKHLSEHSIVPPESVDSSAREFMSSLQKLYKPNLQDNDKAQDIILSPQDVKVSVPKNVHGASSASSGKQTQSSSPPSSNNVNKPTITIKQNKMEVSATSFSNHNDSQDWSKIYNLKKKESTSNENMTAPSTQPSLDNLSQGQTWNNMLKRTSNRQKNKDGRISSSNNLSRNRKKLSFNSRGSSGSLSGHRSRLSFQNLRGRIQRSSTASISSQQSKGNGSGGYNKNSEWKESASPLSSCLKHDDASSTISPSLRQAGRQGRRSSTRSCVSWQIDDTNLDEELRSQAPRISWNLDDTKLDELLPEQIAPSTITASSNTARRFSSVSHGAESISEAQLEQTETPPHSPTARRASLEADEELLASMLHLAKHMGESHSASSTWGNHVSISSLEQSTEISADQEDNEKKPSAIQQDKTLATPPTSSLETSEGQTTAEEAAVVAQETTNKRQDQQDELGGLVRSATTAAAVTRLVYQEVEDYRTRLQRKRASMEEMYGKCNSTDEATSNAASSTSSREDELNELLQENATNISNALLLQRALYTLGIHNSESNRNLVRGASGDDNSIQESATSNTASMPRAHSEHTGINRMAINHLLTLSGTTPKKSTPPVINSSISSGSNAQWGTSIPPFNSSNTSNPSTTSQRRRFTYQEGPEPPVRDEAAFQAQRRASQVGAYQSNEPAPLLFRRTFNASAPNRRATRDEARRNTLQALAMENAAEAAASTTTTRNHSCPASMFDSDVHTFDSGSSAGSYSRSDSLNSNDQQRNTHQILEEIDETSSVSSTHLRSDSLNSREMERQRTVMTSNLTRTSSSVPSSEAESYDDTFCPVNIAPAPPGRSRVGSNISSSTNTQRSSMFSSTNTRGSIRFADLEEQPDQSPITATRPRGGSVGSDIEATGNNASLRNYLMASVRRQSYNSKKMLQAILVSDEIVEADHIETTYHEDSTDGIHGDIEMGESQASMQARLVMMEELLEENEEEQELILERYEKRERIMKGLVSVSVVVIIALVVVIIVSST